MSAHQRWHRWFIRRQGAEAGPIELHRRQIYILPSRSGMLFALVLFVMYLGAVNYNLGLGHALVFLLVGLGIVGMLHAFRNLVGLRIGAGRIGPVFAGETAHFELLIENFRADARPAINLQKIPDNATFNGTHGVDIDLPPSGVSTVTLQVLTDRRGRLPLGRLIVSTRYPLGLFRAWSYPWLDINCLVYPRPEYLPLPNPRASHLADGHQAVRSENPDDFAGFRRHQPGDSPRHVAWKIFARDTANAPLLVKEFSGGGAIQYWFNWDETPGKDIESRLSILCGWILRAQRADLDFGLSLPDRTLQPSHGMPHVTSALEALALFAEVR